jgi:hypothetical protein
MTQRFYKWANKNDIPDGELYSAITEVLDGNFDANLGGNLFKKRIRFAGKGKSGSGRTIICYKKDNRAFYLYGFAKKVKSSLTKTELMAFKEYAAVLLSLSDVEVAIAVKNGDFLEVKK